MNQEKPNLSHQVVLCSAPEVLMKHLTSSRPPTMWRGVGSSTYTLTPSALRDTKSCQLGDYTAHPIDDQYGRSNLAQYSALQNFASASNSAGLALPPGTRDILSKEFLGSYGVDNRTWPEDEKLELLGLAQHYGVPTALLDWSRSPLIAAYFAARRGVDRILRDTETEYRVVDGPRIAIWALRKHHQQDDIEFVIVPTAGNPNLSAQSGLFTLVRSGGPALENRDWPWNFKRFPLPRYDKEPALIKYEIRTTWAPDLLDILRTLTICAATVFPGYEGAAETAREITLANRARRSMNRRPLPD